MNGQRDVGMYGHMMDFWMYRHMDVAMCGKTGEPGNWGWPKRVAKQLSSGKQQVLLSGFGGNP